MNELKLVIGNKNYSSWSMRPWLVLRHWDIPFQEVQIPLRQNDSKARVLQISPSGKVPCLVDGDLCVWESIAICEHLAERHPDLRLWPEDRTRRAVARAVSAEMHAGFQNLRTNMFLNCRARFPGKGRAPGVQEDIDRTQALWRDCRRRHGQGGDFLFGRFSIADAMFAPVVLRFQTYEVQVDPVSRDYADTILGLAAVQDWLEAARQEPWTIADYEYR
jgi:glutathione S-transferase